MHETKRELNSKQCPSFAGYLNAAAQMIFEISSIVVCIHIYIYICSIQWIPMHEKSHFFLLLIFFPSFASVFICCFPRILFYILFSMAVCVCVLCCCSPFCLISTRLFIFNENHFAARNIG